MLAFVKMTFLVRRYGDSRHEDEAKRNPNGHCVDKTGSLLDRGFSFWMLAECKQKDKLVSKKNYMKSVIEKVKTNWFLWHDKRKHDDTSVW